MGSAWHLHSQDSVLGQWVENARLTIEGRWLPWQVNHRGEVPGFIFQKQMMRRLLTEARWTVHTYAPIRLPPPDFKLLKRAQINHALLFAPGAPVMFHDKRVVVVMPAYNAARTLRQTYHEVREQGLVDAIILVDDRSRDETVAVARGLEGVQVHVHEVNKGYGGNQKTCYRLALEAGADIVIMIHPDYQYTPKLIPAMVSIIGNGLHPCVLGSRILGGYALKGGMPVWKYVSNRILTLLENMLLGAKLSEYHTGYRAFSREILETLDLAVNSDDFVFDNQMLAQILWHGFTIAEVSCPTKYFAEASSINLRRSIKYGLGCLATGLRFRLARLGVLGSRLFPLHQRKPLPEVKMARTS